MDYLTIISSLREAIILTVFVLAAIVGILSIGWYYNAVHSEIQWREAGNPRRYPIPGDCDYRSF